SHVVVEPVGLEHAAAHVLAVDEMLYASAGIERARRQKIAEYGMIGEGPVAAMGERARQTARDPPGSDAANEKLEAAEGARRQTSQHIVLGDPARAAGAFHQKF